MPSSTARGGHGPEEQAEEPALLRAENARLRKAGKEWQLDRKIVRAGAGGGGDKLPGVAEPPPL
ncbi:hypothetical protein [Streptomyces sp. NPDC004728]|uniref:hypothetical protein n=1 Tax=Streptomyces sp. NPDC004728 TaxID=3154289 RepID=UPI0033AB6846